MRKVATRSRPRIGPPKETPRLPYPVGVIRAEGEELDSVRCRVVGQDRENSSLLVELLEARPPLWDKGDRVRVGVKEFTPEGNR